MLLEDARDLLLVRLGRELQEDELAPRIATVDELVGDHAPRLEVVGALVDRRDQIRRRHGGAKQLLDGCHVDGGRRRL